MERSVSILQRPCSFSLFVLLSLVCICMISYVHANDSQFSMGINTPYSYPQSTPSRVPDTCVPLHIELVARHGVREPTVDERTALYVLSGKLRSHSISSSEYAYLMKWHNNLTPSDQSDFSYLGQLEQYNLAKRIKETYSPVLSKKYDPNVYSIQATQLSRTGMSASAFAFGFLEGQGRLGQSNYAPIYTYTQTQQDDNTLRFFETCGTYVSEVKLGRINTDEADAYAAENFPKIAQKLTKVLGLDEKWELSVADVKAFFTACAYERSANSSTNFCSLFSEEDIEIYEFAEDLAYYYRSGYGTDLGYKISVNLLADIIKGFDDVITKTIPAGARLKFAHAETILPLVAQLGLFADEKPITASSTPEEIKNRLWRTSKISPYTANSMFVLYQCGADYRLKFLHNEQEYMIPGCRSVHCPYNQFKNAVADALSFNFARECSQQPSPIKPFFPTEGPSPPTTSGSTPPHGYTPQPQPPTTHTTTQPHQPTQPNNNTPHPQPPHPTTPPTQTPTTPVTTTTPTPNPSHNYPPPPNDRGGSTSVSSIVTIVIIAVFGVFAAGVALMGLILRRNPALLQKVRGYLWKQNGQHVRLPTSDLEEDDEEEI